MIPHESDGDILPLPVFARLNDRGEETELRGLYVCRHCGCLFTARWEPSLSQIARGGRCVVRELSE